MDVIASTPSGAPGPVKALPLNPVPAMPALVGSTASIKLSLIDPSPFNPRKDFDKDEIAELGASIQAQGLLENLVVRPKKGGRFELMGGERRYRALKAISADEAKCNVIEADDARAMAVQIVENLQRKDLGPLEEAEAFAKLQQQDPKTWTPQAIAKAVGKTDRFVQQRIALNRNLAPKAKKMMVEGELRIELARTLATAPVKLQDEILEDLSQWDLQDMSADDLRDQIFEAMVPVECAAFDPALYKGEIVEDGKKKYFSDVPQFNRLQQAEAETVLARLREKWPTAVLVESHKLYDFCWGDSGEPLYSSEKKTKANGKLKVPEAKLTAIVWIDHPRIRTAEGVGGRRLFDRASSSSSGGGSGSGSGETAAHRRLRHAYNDRVCSAVAANTDVALRLLLMRCIDGTTRFTYDHGEAKRAHEAILPAPMIEYVNCSFDGRKQQKLWAAVKLLKADAVVQMVTKYTVLSLTWSSTWEKKPPAFTAAIAAELKVKIPTIAEVEEAHEAAKAAKGPRKVVTPTEEKSKPKAKPKAKKKGGKK